MSKTPELFANLSASKGADQTDAEITINDEELSEAEKAAAAAEPEDEEDDADKVDELTLLKQRAKIMGINPGNMGVDALKAKINAKLNDESAADEGATAEASASEAVATEVVKPRSKNNVVALRAHLKREQMKLVRVRITNLDPKDKDLPGNIFTVANEYLGTVSKYVPFGEATENGYHIPYCLYKFMKDMVFTQIRVTKKQGREHIETKDVRKFAIEVLPQLTQAELNRLKTAQIAAGSID